MSGHLASRSYLGSKLASRRLPPCLWPCLSSDPRAMAPKSYPAVVTPSADGSLKVQRLVKDPKSKKDLSARKKMLKAALTDTNAALKTVKTPARFKKQDMKKEGEIEVLNAEDGQHQVFPVTLHTSYDELANMASNEFGVDPHAYELKRAPALVKGKFGDFDPYKQNLVLHKKPITVAADKPSSSSSSSSSSDHGK